MNNFHEFNKFRTNVQNTDNIISNESKSKYYQTEQENIAITKNNTNNRRRK